LPLFDEDREAAGFPVDAERLRALFWEHDGFLIASPEYNGGVTGVLKNAIDWASRPVPGDASTFLRGFRGKVAGVMSTSITGFGGVRGALHLRQILATIQTLVVTENVTVPFAQKAFEDGELVDAAAKQFLAAQVKRVIKVAGALSPRLNP
jgi:chromate reductase, NAD(P)H dehydrogenase (quinone)